MLNQAEPRTGLNELLGAVSTKALPPKANTSKSRHEYRRTDPSKKDRDTRSVVVITPFREMLSQSVTSRYAGRDIDKRGEQDSAEPAGEYGDQAPKPESTRSWNEQQHKYQHRNEPDP